MTWDGGSPSCRRSGVRRWNATSDRLAARAARPAPTWRHPSSDGSRRSSSGCCGSSGEPVQHDLCLAGGVALNCVVNGKIFDETPFRRVYIQPAAYDGGTSVGAAYHVWHRSSAGPRFRDGPRLLGTGVR